MLSIPLEIGLQRRSNRWTYGITAGAVLSFVNKQEGRTIGREMEITDFTENDSTAPFKSFQIGFSASPFIAYSITRKFKLLLQPKWTLYKGSVLEGTDLKVSVQQVNLNLGVGFSF